MHTRYLFLLIVFILTRCSLFYSTEVNETAPPAVRSAEIILGSKTPAPVVNQSKNITPSETRTPTADITPTSKINHRTDQCENYRLPGQLLPFDGIRPVYDPQFASTSQVQLRGDELIMGITFGGESKAYPVSVLRFREMVNDEIAGWPILVTW